ncbi:general substrate transporter [Leptodontidium sp. MPI-SDFR-AT-0119]|nr:general substrate transporter [Leptodontidium sp. MPI-SDFR-AT-0119]
MGFSGSNSKENAGAKRAIGGDLAKVLPYQPRSWIFTPHLLKLNLVILVPLLSQSSCGYDGTMMNGLQTLPQWHDYFNNPSAALLGLLNACVPIACILSFAPVAWLSDKYGRKFSITAGLLSIFVGSALQAGAVNVGMFIGARFILGISAALISQPSPLLVTELAYPPHRAKVTTLYNTFYYLGSVIAAWATYATFTRDSTWAWRIPSLLQIAIPSFQLCFLWWVPESPRWLVANGRVEDARAVLTKYHGNGDENSELVAFEMLEIQETLRLEKEAAHQNVWRDMIATKANRKRTYISIWIGVTGQWLGVGVVFYYLYLVLNSAGITSVKDQTLINGGLTLWNWLWSIAGALMVDRIGRRTLYLTSLSGMLVSYIIWTVLTSRFAATSSTPLGYVVVAMIFIFYVFYDVGALVLFQAYTVEIWPYRYRSNGLALVYITAYASLIVNLFVNPIALERIGWKYYIIYCCLIGIALVGVYYMFPETRGYSLEEIARVFEGEGAHVPDGSMVLDEILGDLDVE